MPLFTLKQVEFKDILRYPDIVISGGGAVFVTGKSGAGKSTLFKLLNGVISPTSGEICFRDKPLCEYNPLELRREVLLVSQSAYLFADTIAGNFTEYYSYLDLPPPDSATIREYLSLCAIDSLPVDSDCTVLSGGERQRVFLAVNLSLPTAKVLLLDEPTSALDSATADKVMSGLKSHAKEKGISLIIISHDARAADKYADEVISL